MGADGGTIPRRDELVRTKKKPEQVERDVQDFMKWTLCSISQEPLSAPIVACELGRLYNKEQVIRSLLSRNTGEEMSEEEATKISHIRSLKDVKELNLTPNASFKNEANNADSSKSMNVAEYICPVVGVEMNGKHRFIFIWTCGCVMSERAIKEVKSDVCHKCQQSFAAADVVVLNPGEQEQSELMTHMQLRREKAKEARKTRKRPANADSGAENSSDIASVPSGSKKSCIKQKELRNGMTSEKVGKTAGPSDSIQKNPNASKVYKSLFTSSTKGQKQERAHWVTYNPFYN